MKTLFARGTRYSPLSKLLIFMAAFFLLMTACNKEEILPGNNTKAVKLPNEPPVSPVGSLKGYTYPVSQEASMKITDENGTSFSVSLNKDGTFFMDNIPAGSYQMVIYYLVNRADNSYYTLFEAGTVRIMENTLNQLGQIDLPWTY